MIPKIRMYVTWSNFVAFVFFVSCVGPAIAECVATGSVTHGTIERAIALATGLKLWFSLIPGTRAIPCPSCGALLSAAAQIAVTSIAPPPFPQDSEPAEKASPTAPYTGEAPSAMGPAREPSEAGTSEGHGALRDAMRMNAGQTRSLSSLVASSSPPKGSPPASPQGKPPRLEGSGSGSSSGSK